MKLSKLLKYCDEGMAIKVYEHGDDLEKPSYKGTVAKVPFYLANGKVKRSSYSESMGFGAVDSEVEGDRPVLIVEVKAY